MCQVLPHTSRNVVSMRACTLKAALSCKTNKGLEQVVNSRGMVNVYSTSNVDEEYNTSISVYQ